MMSLRTPHKVRTTAEVLPICEFAVSILMQKTNPCGCQSTYQEDDRNVQHEGAETVEEKGEETDVVNLSHGNLGDFPQERNNTIHDSANRSKVVQGDKRVHLEVSRAEKSLNHGKAESFKDDATNLIQDTDQNEVDLAEGSNDDTDDDGRNVEELLQIGLGHTKRPTSDQDSDRSSGLEHLDKSNGQVEVGQVATDQAQTEEQANGHNSTQVNTASHLNGLSAIEKSGESSHELGADSRKGHVIGGKDNGVT